MSTLQCFFTGFMKLLAAFFHFFQIMAGFTFLIFSIQTPALRLYFQESLC